MYGYFNLKDVCLSRGERHIFSCYYCRLCYCLWNQGGQVARYLTTYDATVYNLVIALAGFDSKPKGYKCQRIRTSNKKSFKDDEVGNLIAELNVIALAVKAKDNADDGDKTKAFVANLFFHRLFKKTIKKYPDVYQKAYDSVKRLDAAQKANCSVDEALTIYGETMKETLLSFFPVGEEYSRVFVALARWTFLVDMLDDYAKDYKSGALNSFKREDSKTIVELYNKHYDELIPIIRKECVELEESIIAIQDDDKPEWYILEKITSYALKTVIPGILRGEDVKYHYFRDTIANWKIYKKNIEVEKKYEKGTIHH